MFSWLVKRGTYRWEEILETLSGDQGEMHAAEEPGERILDRFFNTIPGADDGFVPATVGHKNAILSYFSLLFREELGVMLNLVSIYVKEKKGVRVHTGQSGRRKKATTATRIDTAPSMRT
jgi:hypothetical protein